jgi:hypothetical protein
MLCKRVVRMTSRNKDQHVSVIRAPLRLKTCQKGAEPMVTKQRQTSFCVPKQDLYTEERDGLTRGIQERKKGQHQPHTHYKRLPLFTLLFSLSNHLLFFWPWTGFSTFLLLPPSGSRRRRPRFIMSLSLSLLLTAFPNPVGRLC